MALGWRDQYNRYKGYFLNIVNLYKQKPDLRAFTEVILSVTTITVFLVFALKPTALTIISLAKEINEKKETVASLNKKISDLNKASDVYSEAASSIPLVNTAVSTKPQPDTISGQVAGLAAKNSVRVLGLSVGQVALIGTEQTTKKSTELKPLPDETPGMTISINIQGDYQGLLSFLKDLENLRIASKIDRLGISASESDGGKIIVALISARVPFVGGSIKNNEEK